MAPPSSLRTFTLLFPLALAACGGFGRVNQGQVIEYRGDRGLVTLIQDSNYRDPAHPRFDVLPPISVRIPQDLAEMGPEPAAGKLLALDSSDRRMVVFDSNSQGLRTVPYVAIEEHDDVASADPRVRGSKLPLVDRANKTITLYWPRGRQLIVAAVADEYLKLPEDSWKAGDEIRYYFKQPGQALRLMNVSKTDLSQAEK